MRYGYGGYHASASRYGDYCNLARLNGVRPISFSDFNICNRSMTQADIVKQQIFSEKPSPEQWRTITRIQLNCGVRFHGSTRNEATAFINQYISSSRAAEMRRNRYGRHYF